MSKTRLLFSVLLIATALVVIISIPGLADDSSAEGPDVGTKFTADKITYEITGNGGGKLSTVTILTCDADLDELRIGDTVEYKWGTPAVTYTYDVTAIADDAFKDHTKIELVTFGKNVASIGKNAFYGCINIEGSISASSVTSIGEKAFYKCLKIESVTMNKLTSIPTSAFERCTSLETVSAVKATTVGNYAFYKCSNLEVCFTTTATSIGNYAFRDCTKLISDCIPTTVQTIGVEAYRNCYGFEGDLDLTGCTALTTISNNAFYNCNNITDLETPDSLLTIGSSAFDHCDNLARVSIGSGLTTLGDNAFYNCGKMESYTVDPSNTKFASDNKALCKKDTDSKYILISCPAKWHDDDTFVIGTNVKEIAKNAFYNCDLIKNITIGSNVAKIGSGAFSDCSELTSVSIPASVTNIEGNPFSSCGKLAAIYVDSLNPNYGNNSSDGVLYEKSGSTLTELITYPIAKAGTTYVIPGTVTKIRSSAFSGNSQLVDVTIPSSVATIDSYAFYNCSALKGTEVSPGVYKLTVPATTINQWAFYNCDALENVILNHNLATVYTNSFHACDNLKSFEMDQATPDTDDQYCTANGVLYKRDLTKDEITLFSCPYGLTTTSTTPLVIPESIAISGGTTEHVKKIGSYAFYGCKELSHLKLATTVSYIDINAFIACNKLAFIDATGSPYYSNVGNILYSADKTVLVLCPGASAAAEIHIDEACTTINSYAFNNCTNINTVYVPANVDTIGQYAFNGCNKVNTMYFESNPTHIGEGAFSMGTSDTPATVIVYGCSDDQFRDYVGQYTLIKYYHYMHYDLNGGIGTAPTSTANVTGEYFNLPALGSWTKTGYYPLGWCEKADGTGSVYAFGNLYAYKSSDTTLYLKWVENEVKIVLKANYTDGTDGQAYATYNSSAFSTEPLKGFVGVTRNGYTLQGYFTAASGGDMVINATTPVGEFVAEVSGYTDADCKWINTTEHGGTVTLYACWTPISYPITLDKNGGKADQSTQYTSGKSSPDTTYTAVERDGYKLLGYTTEKDGDKFVMNADGTLLKGVLDYSDDDCKWTYWKTATVTLYAKWEIETYDITYNLDGGTNDEDNPATYTYETETITLKDPTKTGYTFLGWFSDSEMTVSITTIPKNSMGDKEIYAKWELTEYNLTYELNGGTDNPNPATYTYWTDESVTIQLLAPTKIGYKFVSWHTDSTFTEENKVSHIAAKSTGNKTFYAEWEPIKFTVQFVKNDEATGTVSIQNFTYDVAQNLNKNEFVYTTFKFKGWATTQGSSVVAYTDQQLVSNLSTTDSDTVYLYPVWEQKGTYTAKFYDSSTELTALQISKIADELYELPAYQKEVASVMKTIVGWNTEADFSGTFYSIGTYIQMEEENVTYYAMWEKSGLISVIYDENGGSKQLPEVHVEENTDFNLSYYDGTLTGYHFMGWKLNGTGTTFAGGSVYHAGTSALTFVAEWAPNTYEMQFKTNDSTESGTMSPQTFTYDVEQNLSKNLFTKTGYKFMGWSTVKGGDSVTYTDEQSLKNITTVDKKVYELYPVWQIKQYTVTADLDGGTISPDPTGWGWEKVNDSKYTKKFNYNTAWADIIDSFTQTDTATLSKTGYNTPVWDKSGYLGAADDTMKLSWTASTYTVTFNKKDGTGGSDSVTATYDANMPTATMPTRTGYTFAGYWSSENDDTGTKYYNANGSSARTWNVASDTTLYAHWTENSYKVVFNKNSSEATGTTADQTFTYTESKALTANGFSRTGYDFGGWATTSGGAKAYDDKEVVSKLASANNATFNLYAVWTPHSYTVTFYGNGETSGTMSIQNFVYGTAQNLTSNGFQKTGYSFSGWATSSTGAKVYNNGQSVNKLTAVDGGNVDLYAVWTPNNYTVSLDKQNGTGGTNSITATYDADMPTIGLPTRDGYTFGGYFTQTGGAGTQYYNADGSSAAKWTETTVTKLYAKWTANKYTVSFTNTPSTSVTGNIIATYDAALPDVTAPSLTGYTFLGYFTASDGGKQYYDADGKGVIEWKETSVNNLFAHWQANTYKVVFNKNSDKATGTMSDQPFTYDDPAKALTTNNFERVGYTFGGWAETADGAVKYADKAEVQNLTAEANGTFNLYVVWVPNKYKIDLNGHGAEDGFLYVTYDSNVISDKNLKFRTGYTLTGYYLTNDDPSTKIIAYDGSDVSLVPNVSGITDADGKWIYAGEKEFHAKWTINSYTVTIDLDYGTDGTITPVPTGWTDIGSGKFTKPWEFNTLWSDIIDDFTTNGTAVIKKTGYKNPIFSPSTTTLPASDTTLVVKWTIDSFKVNAKLDNKGTMTDVSSDWNKVSNDEYWRMFEYNTPWAVIQATLPVPTSGTYTFSNWDRTGNLGAAEDTMTAEWTPNIYTAVLDLNGGHFTGSSGVWIQISDYNYVSNFPYETTWDSIKTSVPAIARDGYTFSSWTHPVPLLSEDFQTLRAEWSAAGYTVTLQKEGGSGGSDSVTPTFDSPMETITPPERDGYIFGGYFTGQNGAGTQYYTPIGTSANNWAETDADKLYAKWTPISYEVKFNGNGYTSGYMLNQAFTYDVANNLSANGFIRTGYTFAGWAMSSGGDVVYADCASVSNLTKLNGGIVEIYAKWTPNDYVVTFDKQSGSGGSDGTTATYDAAMPGITIPERTGYTFVGYFTKTGGAGTQYYDENGASTAVWTETSDKTLYADWTVNSYSVRFNGNGCTGGSMSEQSFNYGVAKNLSANAFIRTGYSFAGWAKTAEGEVEYADMASVSNLSAEDGAIVDLYAKWSPVQYNVTLDKQSGTGGTNSITAKYDADMPAITVPSRSGYAFVGYFTEINGAGIKYYNADGSSAAVWKETMVTKLYAYWTNNTYTVKFDGNGNTSGNILDQVFTYGVQQKLASNAYLRTGYTFLGWSETPTGTVKYLNEEAVINLKSEDGAVLTLYAVWQANIYKVLLSGHGADDGSFSITFGTSVMFDKDVKTRTGYTLDGYYSTATGDEVKVVNFNGSDIVLISNVEGMTDAYGNWIYDGDYVLHAKWIANTYTVTFDPDGGTTPSMTSITVTYGEAYGPLATTTKSGSVFVGWFNDNNELVISSTIVATNADHTLHALWYGDKVVHVNVPSGGAGYTVTPGPSRIYAGSNYEFNINVAYGYSGDLKIITQGVHGAIVITGDPANCKVTIYEVMTDTDVQIGGLYPNEYILTLDDIGSKRYAIATYNCLLPDNVTAPVKDGYVFGGYFSGQDGKGEMYYNSAMESKKVWNTTSDGTAYAYWISEQAHTVSYDLNGGNGTCPESQTVLKGKTFTVSYTNATRSDYKFGGWTDGSRTYQPGTEVIMGGSDLNLKAVWNYNDTQEEEKTEFSGHAVDKYGNPFPQADVYIDGEYYTTTNVDGYFEIESITKNIHSMMIVTVVGSKLVYDTSLIDLRDGTEQIEIVIENYSASSILKTADGSDITVAVANLNKEANSQYSGSDVTVTMTVDNSLSTIEGKSAAFQSLKDSMGRPYYQIFDVNVTKTVGGSTAAIGTTTNILKLAVKMNTANMTNIIVSDYVSGEVVTMERIGLDDTPAANTYAVDNGWIYVYLNTSAPVAIGYEMSERSFLLEICLLAVICAIVLIISAYILYTRNKKGDEQN